MTEQLSHLPDNFLDGIEWDTFQKDKPTIYRIQHDHVFLSVVDLVFEEKLYRVYVDTGHLNVDEAEMACKNVPEWWDASMDTDALYDITGHVL